MKIRNEMTVTPVGNSSYKKLAIQWLNEFQFSNQTFVQVEVKCFEIANCGNTQTVINKYK